MSIAWSKERGRGSSPALCGSAPGSTCCGACAAGGGVAGRLVWRCRTPGRRRLPSRTCSFVVGPRVRPSRSRGTRSLSTRLLRVNSLARMRCAAPLCGRRVAVRLETTPAIVLRTREYGESDKIVTVLSQTSGKFSGIAKGAKRSQRRFPGTLEIFSHVTLDYRRRPHSELAFLDRAVLLQPWPRILSSLERFTAASHVVELADKMTVEAEVGRRPVRDRRGDARTPQRRRARPGDAAAVRARRRCTPRATAPSWCAAAAAGACSPTTAGRCAWSDRSAGCCARSAERARRAACCCRPTRSSA